MPYYLVEINLGISDKLAQYIRTTYGGVEGQNIEKFERSQTYTQIILFANNVSTINAILNDVRTHLAEAVEIPFIPED